MNPFTQCATTGLLILFAAASTQAAEHKRPNVLLILADDLRTELGSYGVERVSSPNIDALAASGVKFNRAYCQFPLCNPSRSSMLTSLHPGNVRVIGNRTWFRDLQPALVSLPQHFKDNGYVTLRSGKIFHGGIDDTDAWTVGGERRQFGNNPPAVGPNVRESRDSQSNQLQSAGSPRGRGRDAGLTKSQRSDRWRVIPGDGSSHGDYRVADRAIGYLREYADSESPFFLAVGFSKPHSPPEAPQRFYDLYDVDSIELPVDFEPRPTLPEGFPRGSIRRRNADLFIGRDATPEEAKEMTRAYLASISYLDWNVGRVVDELKTLGLTDDTIVVFWSDHGYQLGEKGKWSKAGSLWEQGTRTPLVIWSPTAEGNGKSSSAIVQAIDIFPTLAELSGLAVPAGLQGRSLAPLLADPDQAWDHPAFTVWSEDGATLTGIVVRVDRWRYAEFTEGGALLIDYKNDPHELKNLAGDPAHADVQAKLARLIDEYRQEHGIGTETGG